MLDAALNFVRKVQLTEVHIVPIILADILSTREQAQYIISAEKRKRKNTHAKE
jgi:hypothetical protein